MQAVRYLLLCALLPFCGCDLAATGTVTGTVLVDKVPTGGLDIRFYSIQDGSMAIGGTGADGKFKLLRGRGDPALPIGEYKVTIAPTADIAGVPMPEIKLSPELLDSGTTPITKTVKAGENVIDIEVSSQ